MYIIMYVVCIWKIIDSAEELLNNYGAVLPGCCKEGKKSQHSDFSCRTYGDLQSRAVDKNYSHVNRL